MPLLASTQQLLCIRRGLLFVRHKLDCIILFICFFTKHRMVLLQINNSRRVQVLSYSFLFVTMAYGEQKFSNYNKTKQGLWEM